MSDAQWYLQKSSDGQTYGPVDHGTLMGWASEAKISPLDKVSKDGRQSWLRAPMVDDLQMDWLIEMPDKYLYGPTNVGTIQEFLATGEVDGNVSVINCRLGTEGRLEDMPFFQASPHHTRSAATTFVGTQLTPAGTTETGLSHRVSLLEKQILEYQRVIDQWQAAYNSLRQQFIEATGREPK